MFCLFLYGQSFAVLCIERISRGFDIVTLFFCFVRRELFHCCLFFDNRDPDLYPLSQDNRKVSNTRDGFLLTSAFESGDRFVGQSVWKQLMEIICLFYEKQSQILFVA